MSFSSSESSPPPVSLDDPPTGVGLSDPHLSGGRRKMLDAVNNLHSTGYTSSAPPWNCADGLMCRVQVDIDIPVIAVIGSQSAGKVTYLFYFIDGIMSDTSTVVAYRENLWGHAAPCQRYLHTVCWPALCLMHCLIII
jgi:hypothetical protein